MADIRDDRSECLHYDNPDFHVQFRKNKIRADDILDDISIHWHDEVEFIYVIKGSIRYQLQDKIVQIKAGEGIFVSSRQLHLIVSNHVEVTLYCLIFHPMILCSSNYVAEKFVSPIVRNDGICYIILSHNVAWQGNVESCKTDIQIPLHPSYSYFKIFRQNIITLNTRSCLRVLRFAVLPDKMDMHCGGRSYIPEYRLYEIMCEPADRQ